MRLILCCAVVGAVRRRADCTPATCVGDDDAKYDRDLFREATVVRRFDDERRYLTVVDAGRNNIWLAARRGLFPSADGNNASVLVETGCDAALTCAGPALSLFENQGAAHNAALWRDGDGLYALGGLFIPKSRRPNPTKVTGLQLRGPVALSEAGLRSLEAAPVRAALPGAHPGGIDRRPRTGTFCEYDGRAAVARVGGSIVAYARANLVRNKTVDGGFGGRAVQAARLDGDAFGAFAPLRIGQYPPPPPPRHACGGPFAGDNVYFAAVAENPVDRGRSVLGLFPVVRNDDAGDDAFVGLALSCDGFEFSPLRRVLNSTPASLGRSSDHPVIGLVARGDAVFFYVHRGVQGVFDDDRDASKLPPSRVVRYAASIETLRAYTEKARAALASCSMKTPALPQRSVGDRCWLDCAQKTRARGQHWNEAIVDACVAACERRAPAACDKRVRLFGVGAKKTGTTSLSAVCRLLRLREMGLRAKARVLDEKLHVRALKGDAQPFVDALSPYECFQDAPFTDPALIPIVARHFPDAKFVLTTRSPDVWAASALRWTQLRSRAYAPYADHFWAALGFRGTPSRDEAAGLLVKHDARVRALTDDVLELDFSTEKSETFWPKVCAFVHASRCPLDQPVPRVVPKGGARDGQPS